MPTSYPIPLTRPRFRDKAYAATFTVAVTSYLHPMTMPQPGDFLVIEASYTVGVWAYVPTYRVILPTSLQGDASESLPGFPMSPQGFV